MIEHPIRSNEAGRFMRCTTSHFTPGCCDEIAGVRRFEFSQAPEPGLGADFVTARAIATLGEALCEARALVANYCDARRKPCPPDVLITRLREILDDETVIAALTDVGYSCD